MSKNKKNTFHNTVTILKYSHKAFRSKHCAFEITTELETKN